MCAAQQFFQWTYDERKTVRTQTAQLAQLAHLWLLTGSPTADQVAENVIIDRLMRALPRPLRRPVSMKNPCDITSHVEAVELAKVTNARDAGEREQDWRPEDWWSGVRSKVLRNQAADRLPPTPLMSQCPPNPQHRWPVKKDLPLAPAGWWSWMGNQSRPCWILAVQSPWCNLHW